MSRSRIEQTRPVGADIDEEIRRRLEALKQMSVSELQDAYYDAHGKATNNRNRPWLLKRLHYRTQELLTGVSLSERARERIQELAEGQEVRSRPAVLPELPPEPTVTRDPRLPPVGTVIRRAYEGTVYEIRVLKDGFEYDGQHYTSLSTIARVITGTIWNGFLWAGLTTRKKRTPSSTPEEAE